MGLHEPGREFVNSTLMVRSAPVIFEALESRSLFNVAGPASLEDYFIDFTSTTSSAPILGPASFRATFGPGGAINTVDMVDGKPVAGSEISGTSTYSANIRSARLKLEMNIAGETPEFFCNLYFITPYGGSFEVFVYDAFGNYGYQTGGFLIYPDPGIGSIRGTVFLDENGDRKLGGDEEYPLEGIRVFIDQNGNGRWDRAERYRFTDAGGHYVFKNINTGHHKVRVGLLPGHRASHPNASGMYVVTLVPGQNANDRHFGQTKRAIIVGRSFYDSNQNGLFDSYDHGHGHVYIDENENGVYDPPEPLVTVPKAGAEWVFPNVKPGVHQIRASIYSGYEILSPSAGFHEVTVTDASIVTGLDITFFLRPRR